uniref:Uncharacterized protein n=1 Tax=Anguilla anguilla TaxID=7936 RepID=A0A0E9QPF2_ANGAN
MVSDCLCFSRRLLEMTRGTEDLGGLRWELFGLLILAWAIVYLCIFKGVKSTGKVSAESLSFLCMMI